MAQYSFGSGVLIGKRTDQTTPTPIKFGTLQEVTVDIDATVKELFGQYQYPVAVGRGTSKITSKAKIGSFSARLLGDLFFNNSIAAGQLTAVIDEADTVGSASTITVNGAVSFAGDFGVVYASTGVPLVRVSAAAPSAAGLYSVNESTGVYTFNSADSAVNMLVSYEKTVSATGSKITITNQLLGTAPIFETVLYGTYGTNSYTLTLNQCVSTKLSLPTKLEDFTIQEFDFSSFADAAGNIGTMSFTASN